MGTRQLYCDIFDIDEQGVCCVTPSRVHGKAQRWLLCSPLPSSGMPLRQSKPIVRVLLSGYISQGQKASTSQIGILSTKIWLAVAQISAYTNVRTHHGKVKARGFACVRNPLHIPT